MPCTLGDTNAYGTLRNIVIDVCNTKPHSITLSFESRLLNGLFKPIIAKSAMYVDLGSRQACKNTAMLKFHYGESESLYFRIQATTCKARRNIERKYLSEV